MGERKLGDSGEGACFCLDIENLDFLDAKLVEISFFSAQNLSLLISLSP